MAAQLPPCLAEVNTVHVVNLAITKQTYQSSTTRALIQYKDAILPV